MIGYKLSDVGSDGWLEVEIESKEWLELKELTIKYDGPLKSHDVTLIEELNGRIPNSESYLTD